MNLKSNKRNVWISTLFAVITFFLLFFVISCGPGKIVYEEPSSEPITAEDLKTGKRKLFQVVERNPRFPGGIDSLKTFISNNLIYPEDAKKAGIEGVVKTRFTVNADGKVVNISVLESVSPLLDEAAIAVISKMPEWDPAHQRMKHVDYSYILPIQFKLSGEKGFAMQKELQADLKEMKAKYKVYKKDGLSMVRGPVKDEKGKALGKATVIIHWKGARFNNGTITNADGKFELTTNKQNFDLCVYYSGYKNLRFPETNLNGTPD